MSLHAVERLLHAMNRDETKAAAFSQDRAAVLAQHEPELTADEIRMLKDADVLGLYRHGVHPLLLAPASRFFGLGQQEFRRALEPAIGERAR